MTKRATLLRDHYSLSATRQQMEQAVKNAKGVRTQFEDMEYPDPRPRAGTALRKEGSIDSAPDLGRLESDG
jgi:hypothetical protein